LEEVYFFLGLFFSLNFSSEDYLYKTESVLPFYVGEPILCLTTTVLGFFCKGNYVFDKSFLGLEICFGCLILELPTDSSLITVSLVLLPIKFLSMAFVPLG
jgi:hypothetical protein